RLKQIFDSLFKMEEFFKVVEFALTNHLLPVSSGKLDMSKLHDAWQRRRNARQDIEIIKSVTKDMQPEVGTEKPELFIDKLIRIAKFPVKKYPCNLGDMLEMFKEGEGVAE